ncbi:hypothetical protein H6P81_003823 [Aristolochia fimbriata]|uniref:SWIM-type domain-containing protein n=1 Tax=Aristolochia fimbriata TaxID=158543 RepID=A0AAV7FDP9_ARIFI|nr:hypothetical protein H6P81_003823 [Aristolochia fimbriata]
MERDRVSEKEQERDGERCRSLKERGVFPFEGIMKGHDAKMPRMEDILNLPVQDPPCAEFSAVHINWAKIGGGHQGGDDIALIPFSRVEDFVKGESANSECPASFRIESRRKRPEGSVIKPRVDGYLEYTLYWCSYGPEDYRECDPSMGDGQNTKPISGKGSRPGRRHLMRGCLCHFTVKRLYTRPLLALIIFNQRNHVDKSGAPCHGLLDRGAVGTLAMYAPRISEELRQRIMSLLNVGVSLDTVIQHHVEEVEKHGGRRNRDDYLTRNDVRNMERVVRHSTHELHANDMCSVRMWVQRHQKNVFSFQDDPNADSFILGIQTEWQLQQMLRYGHNGYIAFHSTFGLNRLQYPLCTLLVFDLCQSAIPVAWIITSSSNNQGMDRWLGLLVDRIRTKDPRWRPHALLVDDPYLEISLIRDSFQCRVWLCLWHIRRSWMRGLLKKCCNLDVQKEMLKHLGRVLYCARSASNVQDPLEEFMQIFIDQSDFMAYFKERWLPNIEAWVTASKTLPMANQEFHAAIESYHLRVKAKLFGDPQAVCKTRIDCLVHTLTTSLHSLYWFEQYSEESVSLKMYRDELLVPNSWQRALQIPDHDIILDEGDLQFVKVISQSDRRLAYTIWNPGSEFSFCDCPWARLGNFCKHLVKVGIICRIRQIARPSLSAQIYHQTLLGLLVNPPDDPIALEHAIVHATKMQEELKSMEDLSSVGLLQSLPPNEMNDLVGNGLSGLPQVAIDGAGKQKRPRTSSTVSNVAGLQLDFSEQASPTLNPLPPLSSNQMREFLHLLKVPQGSSQKSIVNEENSFPRSLLNDKFAFHVT